MTVPVLYSFRRCPFAMRARMALMVSGQTVELREVLLKDKPPAMLAASQKGTVPVLVLPGGTVIDESVDVMAWALAQSDPENWHLEEEGAGLGDTDLGDTDLGDTGLGETDLGNTKLGAGPASEAQRALIARCDGPFKGHLDRYKYASRYDDADPLADRAAGFEFLEALTARLEAHGGQLFRPARALADIAIFPFVRQFRIADPDWFDTHAPAALRSWLTGHCDSALFRAIMGKYAPWQSGARGVIFP